MQSTDLLKSKTPGSSYTPLTQKDLEEAEQIVKANGLFLNSRIPEIIVALGFAKSEKVDVSMQSFSQRAMQIQAAKGPQELISPFLVRDEACSKDYMAIALFIQGSLQHLQQARWKLGSCTH
jgi:hypothetical protein